MIAQATRQLWKASEKCARKALYCCSSGGSIDHDEAVGGAVDCWSVGGGGRHWRQRAGKSSDNGS